MKLRRPRRWSELSRVERVDVYTRQSLYLVLWGMCLAMLFSVPEQTPGYGTAFLVGGFVVTALGTTTLSAVISIYPQTQPFHGGRRWRWAWSAPGIWGRSA